MALSSDKVSERAERDRQRGDVIYNLADAPGQLLSFVSSMAAPLAYLGATKSVSLRKVGPDQGWSPSLFPRGTTIQFMDETIYEEIKEKVRKKEKRDKEYKVGPVEINTQSQVGE